MKYKAVVVGLSSGGMGALKELFAGLPKNFSLPVIVVQHISPRSDGEWIEIMDQKYAIRIKEAEEKEKIRSGTVYLAPPNYHLLVEKNETFSLSIDERVSYARPAIDVLFDTAVEAYKEKLVGIVMTGSNHDGAMGLKKINRCGGLSIVQNPQSAFSSYMPQEAIRSCAPDHILDLEEIIQLLKSLDNPS